MHLSFRARVFLGTLATAAFAVLVAVTAVWGVTFVQVLRRAVN